ncbi:MAG: hypothetical protein Q8904_15960 [Bacteroidota bacterium]|nr:hypothetical protein [Bacteroidota bacterium]
MNQVRNPVIPKLSSEPKAKEGRRQILRKKWITLTYNGNQVKSVTDQYGSQ